MDTNDKIMLLLIIAIQLIFLTGYILGRLE